MVHNAVSGGFREISKMALKRGIDHRLQLVIASAVHGMVKGGAGGESCPSNCDSGPKLVLVRVRADQRINDRGLCSGLNLAL